MRICPFGLLFLLVISPLFGAEPEQITVDLRSPTYEEGVLSTELGGVIETPRLRIQACRIIYSHKKGEEKTILAEGNLLVECGCTLFVGDCLEYNIDTGLGTITNGRSSFEPWYFGGRSIKILPEGDYLIEEAYATTSENIDPSWKIVASELRIIDRHLLIAKNTSFCFGDVPLFWVPTFHANLKSISDHPLRYTVRVGGRQGPRVGMIYEFFSWERWKAFLRLDYNLSRGFGGGLETFYNSLDGREHFHAINYYARDLELSEPHKKNRYRLQGLYEHLFMNDATTLHVSYDKLSDKDMPSDYDDRGIVIETVERTQLHVRHQHPMWIGNFLTRVRANSFQTVKQELPTLDLHWLPLSLGGTGVVMDNQIKASYLDFKYQKEEKEAHDYTSSRIEFNHQFYRSFKTGGTTFTPEAGIVAIYYGNSDDKDEEWATLGLFGCEINKNMYRFFGPYKHVMEPYLEYNYFTSPTTSANDHFIFDMSDGWARLNQLKMGMRHQLYRTIECGAIARDVSFDIYTLAFFNTPTIPKTWPKIYFESDLYTTPSLRHLISFAWDFDFSLIDHFNFRTEYTINGDSAIAVEYRHRSPYAWRKVNHANFILDSFRTVEELRGTQISDRRDTFTVHLFHRILPEWAIEIKSRYGWNRDDEKNYREMECNLIGTIRSTWHVVASYQYREDDRRFAISFNVGENRPDKDPCSLLPLAM